MRAPAAQDRPATLVMENFRLRAGFEAIHVPYRGNPPMVTDLLAGQVKAAFVTSSGMMDHVQADRLRPLGCLARGALTARPGCADDRRVGLPRIPESRTTM